MTPMLIHDAPQQSDCNTDRLSNVHDIKNRIENLKWPAVPPPASIKERLNYKVKIGMEQTYKAGLQGINNTEIPLKIATFVFSEKFSRISDLPIAINAAIRSALMAGFANIAIDALFNMYSHGLMPEIRGRKKISSLEKQLSDMRDMPKANLVTKKIVGKVIPFTDESSLRSPLYGEQISKMAERVIASMIRKHLPHSDGMVLLRIIAELNRLHDDPDA